MNHALVIVYFLAWLSSPWQLAGEQALREVKWDWRPPSDWDTTFEPGREKYLGGTNLDKKIITVWVRPEQSPKQLASTLVHEYAHVFAKLYMTESLRREWLLARGLPLETRWNAEVGEEDYSLGEGDFAESLVWTVQGYSYDSSLKVPPNSEQQELIRKWLRELPKKGRIE